MAAAPDCTRIARDTRATGRHASPASGQPRELRRRASTRRPRRPARAAHISHTRHPFCTGKIHSKAVGCVPSTPEGRREEPRHHSRAPPRCRHQTHAAHWRQRGRRLPKIGGARRDAAARACLPEPAPPCAVPSRSHRSRAPEIPAPSTHRRRASAWMVAGVLRERAPQAHARSRSGVGLGSRFGGAGEIFPSSPRHQGIDIGGAGASPWPPRLCPTQGTQKRARARASQRCAEPVRRPDCPARRYRCPARR